jgi:hypothetical protein
LARKPQVRFWKKGAMKHGSVSARFPGTRVDGSPFDLATVEAVWRKATPCDRHPGLARDAFGDFLARGFHGQKVSYGWEIDHIQPVAQGGTDDVANLQPLFWENNRRKADHWPRWEGKRQSEITSLLSPSHADTAAASFRRATARRGGGRPPRGAGPSRQRPRGSRFQRRFPS